MKTQIGLPVQLFANTTKGRETFAAIIVDLRDLPYAETDLMVFTKENARIYARSVRHKDFKKDGENYWDFLEENLNKKSDPLKNEEATITITSSEHEELLNCKVFLHRFLADFAPDSVFAPTYLALEKAYSLLPKLRESSKPFLSKENNNIIK